MISAFGVDHGEIEKAFGFGALGSKIAGGAMKLGSGLRRSGASNMAMGRKAGGGFGQGMRAGGAARVAAGGQLRKLGQGMAKRPGLTGGITAGVGATGVGAAGGSLMNRKKY